MNDLRPDIVFVVSLPVWRDFCALRSVWSSPLCVGLGDECITYLRRAIRAGEPEKAAHWKAVREFSYAYGLSWCSAVEVDGYFFREVEKQSVLKYPPDNELKRVIFAPCQSKGQEDEQDG